MDNIPSELTARLSRFEGQVGREDRAAEALLVRGDRTEVVRYINRFVAVRAVTGNTKTAATGTREMGRNG